MLEVNLWVSPQDWRPDLSPALRPTVPFSWLILLFKVYLSPGGSCFFGAFGLEIKVSGISHSFYNRHSEKKSCFVLLIISVQSTRTESLICIHQCWLRKQLLRQQFSYSKSVVIWTRVCNSYAVFSNSYNALVQCGDVSTLQVIYLGLSFIEQQ